MVGPLTKESVGVGAVSSNCGGKQQRPSLRVWLVSHVRTRYALGMEVANAVVVLRAVVVVVVVVGERCSGNYGAMLVLC